MRRSCGSLPAARWMTCGYQRLADGSPRAIWAATCASACWVLWGTEVSARYCAISRSGRGLPNQVEYQKRKVMRMTRIGMTATAMLRSPGAEVFGDVRAAARSNPTVSALFLFILVKIVRVYFL